MSNPAKLFQTLFHRNPQDPGTETWLSEITEKHPYFAAARFYRLSGMNRSDNDFNHELAKTSLYFNHNYWLNYQLGRHGIGHGGTSAHFPVTGESLSSELIVSEAGKLIAPEEAGNRQDADEEIPDVTDIVGSGESFISEQFSVDETAAAISNHLQQAGEAAPEIPDTLTTVSSSVGSQGTEYESRLPEISIGTDEVTEELKSAEQIELSSDFLEIASAKTEQVTGTDDTKDELPIFEPLHTTDYFASQGIKAPEVVHPDDKLGQKLKRFTDWLKTMKRISDVDASPESAPVDVAVEQLAEKSNQAEEVVTEAMAEILLMQGLRDKAIDIFRKLSLLNPDKSGYFASRIEELIN